MLKKILAFLIFLIFGFSVAFAVDFSCSVTSPYPYRNDGVTPHHGIDLGAPDGTDPDAFYGTVIPALTDGYVWGDQTGMGINPDGYGNMIAIVNDLDHPTFGYVYGHMQTIYDNVVDENGNARHGAFIHAGDPVAEIGSEGSSDGPHLHISMFYGAPYSGAGYLDPDEFYAVLNSSPYFHIDGDITNNTIGNGVRRFVKKIIPHVNVDFSTLFVPSETLETLTKTILEKIVPAFDFGVNSLYPLLVALAVLDFVWFMIPYILGTRGGSLLGQLVGRLVRYGFIFFFFTHWHTVVDEIFIPFMSGTSTVFSGHQFEESTFMHFDELFTSVTRVIGPFIHVDERFNIVIGILVFFVVLLILALTMVATIYLMYKLIIFYIMCAFGVLGIPLLLAPRTFQSYGHNFISSILTAAFDLIMSAFVIGFIITSLNGMEPLDGNSVPTLLTFASAWGLLVFFLPAFSKSAVMAFQSLWS